MHAVCGGDAAHGSSACGRKPTEYIGTETREVEHHTKDMPHGQRSIIVQYVDVEEYEVRGNVS